MNIFIALLVFANTVISVVLLLLWLRSLQQTQALLEAATLTSDDTLIPAILKKSVIAQQKRIITVEILNPTELAIAKSKFAKPLIGLAPDTINKRVYKEARDILAQQLPTFGVNATVSIHVT